MTEKNSEIKVLLANHNLQGAVQMLMDIDKNLHIISNKCDFDDKEFVAVMMSYFQGQFCLHAAACLLLRQNNKFELMHAVAPLLLLAVENGPINDGLLSTRQDRQQHIYEWQIETHFRIFQSHLVLQSFLDVSNSSMNNVWQNLKQIFPNSQTPFTSLQQVIDEFRSSMDAPDGWQLNIYRNLFGQDTDSANSNLVHSKEFGSKISCDWIWPWQNNMFQFKFVADSNRLFHHAYMLLSFNFDADYKFEFIEQCTTNADLAPNRADMYAFVYATAFHAKSISTLMPYTNMLPTLCTDEQLDLWENAVQVGVIAIMKY